MSGIWIREQDGEDLVLCKAIILNYECRRKNDGVTDGGMRYHLGTYQAEDRAKQVIDTIQQIVTSRDVETHLCSVPDFKVDDIDMGITIKNHGVFTMPIA